MGGCGRWMRLKPRRASSYRTCSVSVLPGQRFRRDRLWGSILTLFRKRKLIQSCQHYQCQNRAIVRGVIRPAYLAVEVFGVKEVTSLLTTEKGIESGAQTRIVRIPSTNTIR